jgi:hypothetical protein
MRPFIKVNECTINWHRATSMGCPPLGEVAGPNRNVARVFALLLSYVWRFVPCRISEVGEISFCDRSAIAPYALFITGTCWAGCSWVRGASS